MGHLRLRTTALHPRIIDFAVIEVDRSEVIPQGMAVRFFHGLTGLRGDVILVCNEVDLAI
jgi:hypothetical protein